MLASARKRSIAVIAAGALVGATILVFSGRVSARGNVGAPVQQSTTSHTISVAGHGDATASPDQATVNVGAQSKGDTAQDALSKNSDRLSAIVAAIKGLGVAANKIQTTNLSLWFDSQQNSYIVSHDLTVKLDDINKVGPVLDAAVAAGATSSWGVNFDLKDSSVARSQALKSAVADARKRADSMASALGVSVTGVGSASEASYSVSPPLPYAAASRAPAVGNSTPVQAGELTVTADVTVVYTFG